MNALSNSFLLKLERALTTDYFLYDDFNIKTTDRETNVRLQIIYLYVPQYKLDGMIYKSGNKFDVEITPGSIVNMEKQEDITEYFFFILINHWLDYIYRELQADPIARRLTSHEDVLNNVQQKIHDLENADDKFSSEEGEELKTRLDELEKMFTEKLATDTEDESKYNNEIKKLHAEINALKVQIDAFSKKNWYLSFSTRLYLWYKRNPIAMRQIAGASREFLPDELKDVVSDEALDQLLLPSEIPGK